MSDYTTLADVTLPGSNVNVKLIGIAVSGRMFYSIDIDGAYWDGDYCTLAEGIDRLANPFNVKRAISQAEHYDAIDRDFEHCYSRV